VSSRGALAFDLDGTLIDARDRQVGVAVEAFQLVTGETLAATPFWRAKRRGATTRVAVVGLGVADDVAGEVAAHWGRRIEDDDWLARDRRLPGVAGVLRGLRGAGWRISILTARRRPEGVAVSLAATGLADLVDEVVAVDPSRAEEDKAAALQAGGFEVFIGDTESDGAAAQRAGVPFVGVSTGQRSPGYLRARGLTVARSLGEAVRLAGVRVD
jgi:phosphoglycolate phosphatase-like HAD superfamily hydrolase